ncbi:helix-turn-helix domain-containing protein [Saccharothrix coeruleofusca]|uniref:Transcriptional regulator n=1 Tax=Saccharothrix coeruleofusca TaxID=33919 RepID=A0A918AKT0_9PSEU|nr:helix-turn-helix transcriptional regulator [Saccharothrix coeruleofusca]MBP2339816.1 transcriptional regulator with XRE-family HTH domain [Saccharothrix coeruleofusca]GGP39499.1 transcriptional regulator [Saccharothrix coeruleofusca]
MTAETGAGSANRLGDYLRARRELVSPGAVGLPEDSRRRVPGLRREEVAMLAGISSDYYHRLEQGRNRNPSAQVLEAIAGVLRLDESSTEHLLELGAARPRPRRTPRRRETVAPRIVELVHSLTMPAFVGGRYLDVLASNSLARALSPEFETGENLLRAAFLGTEGRVRFDQREMVAMFRKRVGTDLDDPRVVRLVGELSLASAAFQRAWARHDVRPARGGPVHVDHPQVGPMELNLSKLVVDDIGDQWLVVYHPAAEHPESADRLALLASLVARVRPTSREDVPSARE